jgi:lauroyl/myristoyl acyltransferase
MVEILGENGIVGIANILMSGSRLVEVPFGASARLAMPTGPANLALQRGAALFPVATIETEPLASYSVIIGPQLVLDASKGKDAALADAATQYAERLLPLVKSYPDQWLGWRRHSLSL